MAAVGEFAHQLLDEERIAARPVGDQWQQRRHRLVVAQQMGGEFVGGVLAQRRQGDLVIAVAAHPGRGIAGPEVHQQQEARADQGLRQNFDQRFAAGIHEVEILEQDDRRRGRSRRTCKAPEECLKTVAACSRVHLGERGTAGADAQEVREQRQFGTQCRIDAFEDFGRLGPVTLGRVVGRDLEECLQDIDDRLERRGPAVCQGPSFEHAHALRAASFGEFERQATLADAGLGHHADGAAIAFGCALQVAFEQGQFGVAPDEARAFALKAETLAGRAAPQAGQQEYFHRCRQATHLAVAQGLDGNELAGAAQGGGRDRDPAQRRQALQAARDVNGDAGGVEISGEIGGHGARQNFARMNADADRQCIDRQGLDRGLHREARAAGPHGMVFLRVGRPEERHDTVTLDLDHRTLETPDGLLHGLEGGGESLGGFFRVELLD